MTSDQFLAGVAASALATAWKRCETAHKAWRTDQSDANKEALCAARQAVVIADRATALARRRAEDSEALRASVAQAAESMEAEVRKLDGPAYGPDAVHFDPSDPVTVEVLEDGVLETVDTNGFTDHFEDVVEELDYHYELERNSDDEDEQRYAL